MLKVLKRGPLCAFLLGLGLAGPCRADDIVNPYAWTAPNLPSPQAVFDNYSYNGVKDPIVPYNGELQVSLADHYWYTDPIYRDLAKSYTIEAVGFPFDAACAWQSSGCLGLPDRTLRMPSGTWDPGLNGWKYTSGAQSQWLRLTTPAAGFTDSIAGTPQGLVSNLFISPSLTAFASDRRLMPHTALKITVRLHCGPSTSNSVASSISFVYDNTRGRLRSYPFWSWNTNPGSNTSVYDLLYRPELLHDPIDHRYDRSDSFLEPNATIDYFPYRSGWGAGCSAWFPASSQEIFSDSYGYYYPFPPPYALVSAYARTARGRGPAGYSSVTPSAMSYPSYHAGIPHTYVIDQNLDLRRVNPGEKLIYNPSAADITASNLVLPCGYTFKTVRGAYPTRAEVQQANTAQNGGPYADLRRVPVPTDTSPTSDPRDASVYTLKSGARLTIEPCVSVYDATFVVQPGAMLIYTPSRTYGRFKIVNLGGTVKTLGFPPGASCACFDTTD